MAQASWNFDRADLFGEHRVHSG